MEKIEQTLELMIQYEKRGGLVPTVAQDTRTGEILMLGYVNQLALDETLRLGYATFWSTSRQKLWTKGETSGDFLAIKEILVDCYQDALIYLVEMLGDSACHTKKRSCFYRKIKGDKLEKVY